MVDRFFYLKYVPDISPIQYAMLKVVPVFNKNALYVIHEVLLEYSEMYRKFIFLAQYSILWRFRQNEQKWKISLFPTTYMRGIDFCYETKYMNQHVLQSRNVSKESGFKIRFYIGMWF